MTLQQQRHYYLIEGAWGWGFRYLGCSSVFAALSRFGNIMLTFLGLGFFLCKVRELDENGGSQAIKEYSCSSSYTAAKLKNGLFNSQKERKDKMFSILGFSLGFLFPGSYYLAPENEQLVKVIFSVCFVTYKSFFIRKCLIITILCACIICEMYNQINKMHLL